MSDWREFSQQVQRSTVYWLQSCYLSVTETYKLILSFQTHCSENRPGPTGKMLLEKSVIRQLQLLCTNTSLKFHYDQTCWCIRQTQTSPLKAVFSLIHSLKHILQTVYLFNPSRQLFLFIDNPNQRFIVDDRIFSNNLGGCSNLDLALRKVNAGSAE